MCVSGLVRDGALACVRACARVNVWEKALTASRRASEGDSPSTNKQTQLSFAESEYHSLRIANPYCEYSSAEGLRRPAALAAHTV